MASLIFSGTSCRKTELGSTPLASLTAFEANEGVGGDAPVAPAVLILLTGEDIDVGVPIDMSVGVVASDAMREDVCLFSMADGKVFDAKLGVKVDGGIGCTVVVMFVAAGNTLVIFADGVDPGGGVALTFAFPLCDGTDGIDELLSIASIAGALAFFCVGVSLGCAVDASGIDGGNVSTGFVFDCSVDGFNVSFGFEEGKDIDASSGLVGLVTVGCTVGGKVSSGSLESTASLFDGTVLVGAGAGAAISLLLCSTGCGASGSVGGKVSSDGRGRNGSEGGNVSFGFVDTDAGGFVGVGVSAEGTSCVGGKVSFAEVDDDGREADGGKVSLGAVVGTSGAVGGKVSIGAGAGKGDVRVGGNVSDGLECVMLPEALGASTIGGYGSTDFAGPNSASRSTCFAVELTRAGLDLLDVNVDAGAGAATVGG